MKQYKAVFFDWDGTAVISRKAPADAAAAAMKGLLSKGVHLIIVSGTTYNNIAGGRIHDYFTEEELKYLYLGLGRGAYNYRFDGKEPVIFKDRIPDKKGMLEIHDICYEIHRQLLEEYGFKTDIVFTRPNYCKIDIMVGNDREENLFMQENELDTVCRNLEYHGIGGIRKLLDMAEETGGRHGVKVCPTCDAKYLEVGISNKSDNVDLILEELYKQCGLQAQECCFWGDEFVGLEDGIFGSDSYMRTEKSRKGDFYDVSSLAGQRPDGVKVLGGGIERFLSFLQELAVLWESGEVKN